ncbi:hypothetical protein HMPREF0021_00970 [Acinetobacter baumannii 6013150]|nr:hypothetical protein HMPREF0021_00970 [Acinetobacter baumannii 6013150]EGJ64384.1 hypothetical protein HMPREF0020_02018 [Acinetobacter baumannii 6013113]
MFNLKKSLLKFLIKPAICRLYFFTISQFDAFGKYNKLFCPV